MRKFLYIYYSTLLLLIHPFMNKEDRNKYLQEYRAKNKDRLLEYARAYEEANKEKRKLQKKNASAAYRKKNPERIKNQNKPLHRRWMNMQYDAKRRGIEFNLIYEDWLEEVSKPCAYCSNKLYNKSEHGSGVDRKDNNLGYVKGNIVSCCKICNQIKNKYLNYEEMLAVVQTILNIRNSRNSSHSINAEHKLCFNNTTVE